MKAPHFLHQAKSIGLLALASSALGFARDLLIAHKFGATTATDAYLVALAIPTTLYAVFLGSGLNFAMIPRLAHIVASDPYRGKRLFSQVLTILCMIGFVGSLFILLFPRPLIYLFAPGIVSIQAAEQFTRTLSPLFFLLVASYTFASFHCARNHAPYWRLVTFTQNVVVVAIIVLLSSLLGFSSVIAGTVAGAFLALVLQATLARRARFSEPWSIPTAQGEAMGILGALVPFALVFGIGGDSGTDYADLFLLRHYASRLDAGSITLLVLGNKLMGVPVVFVGSAIGLALLPNVSQLIQNGDVYRAAERLTEAFSYALLIICPVAVMYWDLGGALVSAIFRHGSILPSQVIQLGHILRAYAGATVGLTMVYVLAGFLGALRRTRTLIATGICTVVLNATLMKYLAARFGATGIAAAISTGSLVYCTAMMVLLTRILGTVALKPMFRRATLLSAGSVGMHLAIAATARFNIYPLVPWIGKLLVPGIAAILCYGVWVAVHHRRLLSKPTKPLSVGAI